MPSKVSRIADDIDYEFLDAVQLVFDRRLCEYLLPDGWIVIAAENQASERSVHFSMPRPLRNRFVHLHLEADLSDWCFLFFENRNRERFEVFYE
jgi:MoxR-like ATPase